MPAVPCVPAVPWSPVPALPVPVPLAFPPPLLLKQFVEPAPTAQTNSAARTPERDLDLE
jgi:hypothetical protein